jgi:hypothetical protein
MDNSDFKSEIAKLNLKHEYTKESINNMEVDVKKSTDHILQMIGQLKNIEQLLTETLKKVNKHIDPKAHKEQTFEDWKSSMTDEEVYKLYEKMQSIKKVQEAEKKKWEQYVKDKKGSLSLKFLLWLSALITSVITTILIVYTKIFIGGK